VLVMCFERADRVVSGPLAIVQALAQCQGSLVQWTANRHSFGGARILRVNTGEMPVLLLSERAIISMLTTSEQEERLIPLVTNSERRGDYEKHDQVYDERGNRARADFSSGGYHRRPAKERKERETNCTRNAGSARSRQYLYGNHECARQSSSSESAGQGRSDRSVPGIQSRVYCRRPQGRRRHQSSRQGWLERARLL